MAVNKYVAYRNNGITKSINQARYIEKIISGTKKTEDKGHEIKPLRASITPGTVLIILKGKYKGSNVIYLKRLESGLLLVTGPYSINKVPFLRIGQEYVIATSVKIEIDGIKIDEEINDNFLMEISEKNGKKSEIDSEAKENNDQKLKDFQNSIDCQLIEQIKKIEFLEGYLKKKFTLKRSDIPHKMKF